jgi:hybrid cluster-associated redox disulfide protein
MITKDMLISEALKLGDTQKLAEVFASFGMHCLGCLLAHGETVEQAAAVHGIDADALVKELNFALK